jgi:predicted cupin superfamily sugar epimerase
MNNSHVEGGAFRETYRADMLLPQNILTAGHKGERAVSTAIYFLLQAGEFSAFHRIASDELWHHYDGNALSIYEITASGVLLKHLLGKNLDMGETRK